MNDIERKKFPGSVTHLNEQSGLAFYVRCELPGKKTLQFTTDETWRVRRNPDGAWNTAAYPSADWKAATPLPEGAPRLPGAAQRKKRLQTVVGLGSRETP